MTKLICIKGEIKNKTLISDEDNSKYPLRNVLSSLKYKGFVQIKSNSDKTWSLLRTLKEDKGNNLNQEVLDCGKM